MGGGIMQLTATGIHDNYITGNPQITFFKSVYRRHTNFAIESIQQIIDGDLGTESINTNSTVKLSKSADLLNNIYIVCPQKDKGINSTEVVSSVDLVIGGSLIDRHTNEWMKVWDELTIDKNKKDGYKYMTGGYNKDSNKTINNQSSVIIPLNFWFCRHIGLSLPLISIQYHDIILKIEWGINSDINRDTTDTSTTLCEVWTDNIFLDSEERKRFGENDHEYLIEQLQIIDTKNISPSSKFKLNSFNHPIKEIIWTEDGNKPYNVTNEKINITINGIERLSEQFKEYYTLKQPYYHHTNIPSYNIKEYEEPVFLETPIDVGIANHKNAETDLSSDGQNIKLSNTFIDFNIGATIKFKVGDIVTIWRNETSTMTQIVTITSIKDYEIDATTTTKRVSFSPDLNGTVPATNGIDTKCYILARRDIQKASYSNFNKNIYVYSFSLNPEEHQPSGTCNFSRLNDCKLVFNSSNNIYIDNVFATNYNILRISNGLTNLRFTN